MHAPLRVQISLTQQVLGMTSSGHRGSATPGVPNCQMHGSHACVELGQVPGRCPEGSGVNVEREEGFLAGSGCTTAAVLRARGVLMSYVLAALENC